LDSKKNPGIFLFCLVEENYFLLKIVMRTLRFPKISLNGAKLIGLPLLNSDTFPDSGNSPIPLTWAKSWKFSTIPAVYTEKKTKKMKKFHKHYLKKLFFAKGSIFRFYTLICREKKWNYAVTVDSNIYKEEDNFRISEGDLLSRCELIKYLLRSSLFSEAYKQILIVKKESNLPPIFMKYEGILLLNLNREDEAQKVLDQYIKYLYQQLQLKVTQGDSLW
jgi:hypothetical protein